MTHTFASTVAGLVVTLTIKTVTRIGSDQTEIGIGSDQTEIETETETEIVSGRGTVTEMIIVIIAITDTKMIDIPTEKGV